MQLQFSFFTLSNYDGPCNLNLSLLLSPFPSPETRVMGQSPVSLMQKAFRCAKSSVAFSVFTSTALRALPTTLHTVVLCRQTPRVSQGQEWASYGASSRFAVLPNFCVSQPGIAGKSQSLLVYLCSRRLWNTSTSWHAVGVHMGATSARYIPY